MRGTGPRAQTTRCQVEVRFFFRFQQEPRLNDWLLLAGCEIDLLEPQAVIVEKHGGAFSRKRESLRASEVDVRRKFPPHGAIAKVPNAEGLSVRGCSKRR